MKKKIQFSLVYRDMWQSSGKFQPRKDSVGAYSSRYHRDGLLLPRGDQWWRLRAGQPFGWRKPQRSRPCLLQALQRGGYQDPHARPRPQRTAHVSRARRCPRDDVSREARTGCGHPPHLRRSERHPQHRSVHPLGQGGRHDPAGHALHHHLPHPHAGILQQARRRGDCCRSGGRSVSRTWPASASPPSSAS